MGGKMRLYLLPDGTLLGFEREQGGFAMWAEIPGRDKKVYAYVNPEDDYRFELVAAVRSKNSIFGRKDAIMLKDNKTGSVKRTTADFLGVAYEIGANRYLMGRQTHTIQNG